MLKSKISIGLLLLVLGTFAKGAASDASEQTVITSDTLLFDYQRSIAVFEGNVRVVDAQVTLTCAKLYVYFDGSNQITSVVARENVHIVQGDRHASAGRAVYRASEGSIVLTENARLYRGAEELRGDEIQIFTQSEKVIAKPARLVVTPGSTEAIVPR
ncbi:MAG: LptA/OstA family protein [Kiritimatiellia bacterium]